MPLAEPEGDRPGVAATDDVAEEAEGRNRAIPMARREGVKACFHLNPRPGSKRDPNGGIIEEIRFLSKIRVIPDPFHHFPIGSEEVEIVRLRIPRGRAGSSASASARGILGQPRPRSREGPPWPSTRAARRRRHFSIASSSRTSRPF